MKQAAPSEPVIVIEWNSHESGQQSAQDTQLLSKDDLLALARALGRLQARRDLAGGALTGTSERLSSGAKGARMKDVAPVHGPMPSDIAE